MTIPSFVQPGLTIVYSMPSIVGTLTVVVDSVTNTSVTATFALNGEIGNIDLPPPTTVTIIPGVTDNTTNGFQFWVDPNAPTSSIIGIDGEKYSVQGTSVANVPQLGTVGITGLDYDYFENVTSSPFVNPGTYERYSDIQYQTSTGLIVSEGWNYKDLPGVEGTLTLEAIKFVNTPPPTPTLTPIADFNGDNRSDLIFQNGGTFTEWQSTGNGFTSNVYVNSIGAGWSPAGIADFNGDGKSDLIFQNGGTYTEWQSTGNGFNKNVDVFSVGAGWNLAGSGDFNGDGQSDLIFQNGATFTEWQSTGNGFTSNVYVNSVGAGWHLAGVGDFNGDGMSDLIWQNGGTFTEWRATEKGSSNSFAQNVCVNNVGAGWRLAGVGDFNGDGMSDLIWQNGGTFSEWQSNGSGFKQNVVVDTLGAGWSVAAVGDFNGDSFSDILFRNTNGTFSEWQSTGTGFKTNVYVNSNVGNAWTLEYSPTGASGTPGAPAGLTAGTAAENNNTAAGSISTALTTDAAIGLLNQQSSLVADLHQPIGGHPS